MHHGNDMDAWRYFTGPHAVWWIFGIAAIIIVGFLILKKSKSESGGE